MKKITTKTVGWKTTPHQLPHLPEISLYRSLCHEAGGERYNYRRLINLTISYRGEFFQHYKSKKEFPQNLEETPQNYGHFLLETEEMPQYFRFLLKEALKKNLRWIWFCRKEQKEI